MQCDIVKVKQRQKEEFTVKKMLAVMALLGILANIAGGFSAFARCRTEEAGFDTWRLDVFRCWQSAKVRHFGRRSVLKARPTVKVVVQSR